LELPFDKLRASCLLVILELLFRRICSSGDYPAFGEAMRVLPEHIRYYNKEGQFFKQKTAFFEKKSRYFRNSL